MDGRQVQALSDHIEKLMMFLKHEATQKAKAHEQQRRLQKELELVKVGLRQVPVFFCLSRVNERSRHHALHTAFVAGDMNTLKSRERGCLEPSATRKNVSFRKPRHTRTFSPW